MEEEGLTPDELAFSSAAEACLLCGHTDQAAAILKDMQTRGNLQPDSHAVIQVSSQSCLLLLLPLLLLQQGDN